MRLLKTVSMAAVAFAILGGLVMTAAFAQAAPARSGPGRDGIVKVRSAYSHEETITRLKQDVEAKGIRFFQLVEQSKLAAAAGIDLRPSSLLIFGNPALGSQFITANPLAGLDWPVRVLIYSDAKGQVWTAYTDFAWIARRHGIRNRTAAFKMATGVIASITSAVAARPGKVAAAR